MADLFEDPSLSDDLREVQALRKKLQTLVKRIKTVIVGQDRIILETILSLLCRGHVLLEGVPGLAKTLLVRTLGDLMALDFQRIQFTPDLMPTDIIGAEVIEEDPDTGRRSFRFIEGPIFCQILLADEINRTPPKTQAALLEAMQEYSVTTAGETRKLSQPFFVLATQNPIEQEGTYPLPEAQLDRFFMKIQLDYPTAEQEEEIVLKTTVERPNVLEPVFEGPEILNYQKLVRKLPVARHVARYAVSLVTATRPRGDHAYDFVKQLITWGAGPRASQSLVLGAKAHAIVRERLHCSIEDVQAVAAPVLRHRLKLSFEAESTGQTVDEVIQKILKIVPIPEPDKGQK
jgi:MoxR-like ATPase